MSYGTYSVPELIQLEWSSKNTSKKCWKQEYKNLPLFTVKRDLENTAGEDNPLVTKIVQNMKWKIE